MPNILESTINTIKSFVDKEPKPPLHIGEAMACWTYIAALEEAMAYEEAALNTTTNGDLKQAFVDGVKMCNSQITRLKEFMRKEGIPLPPVPEDKPYCDPNSIPYGVRATDNELANGISLKVAAAIVTCATAASQSIRNDVGLMFLEFESEMVIYGGTFKSLMRKHGWIKVPPYFIPPGTPVQ